MRYTCDDPAFAGDFVEFSDSWSRAQVRALWDAVPTSSGSGDDGPFLDALRPKIIALRLTCVDAPPIAGGADLTPARTEEMDTRLYTWFSSVWIKHLGELTTLGNALGRQLWSSSALSKTKTPTKTQPTAHRKSRKS